MNKTSMKILQQLVEEGIFQDPTEAGDLIINLLRTPDVLSLYLKQAIPASVLLKARAGETKTTYVEGKVSVSNEIQFDENLTEENMDSIPMSSALKKIQSLDINESLDSSL